MILQTSIDFQVKNAWKIATHAGTDGIRAADELVSGYRAFLTSCRPTDVHPMRPEIGYDVIQDDAKIRHLVELFTVAPATAIDDLNQSNAFTPGHGEDSEHLFTIICDGLRTFSTLCREQSQLFDLVVGEIVILPSEMSNGGSSSNAVGTIWANPSANWRQLATIEFLVHEFTHQCMFIDEICHGHYDYDKILRKENWTQSAILHQQRPVDKVLHSIVVATELLLTREHLLGHPASPRCHPPSSKLRTQALAAIESLNSLLAKQKGAHLLTERSCEILENCQERISHLDLADLEF